MYSVSINPLDISSLNAKTITGQENKWQLFKIDGLHPANATINLDTAYDANGGFLQYRKLETRNIVLYIRLNGDVEANRWELYPYTATNTYVQLRFTTPNRDMYINGYVQSNEIDFWSMGVVMQVSILCPDPLLKDWVENTVTLSTSGSTTISNEGDVSTGFTATMVLSSSVYGIRLYNSTTGEDWSATGSNVFSGTFTLCTENGKCNLTKSGVSYARYVDRGSKFWELIYGNNSVRSYYKSSSSGSWTTGTTLAVSIKYRKTYAGA